MVDRVPIGARADPDVYERFKEFTIEHKGTTHGELGRMLDNAMMEYMDNDRAARIEDKLNRALARMDELDGTHTHKASETSVKVEKMESELGETGRTVIKDDTVQRSIENIAGADDRTIDKYRTQLKRRGLAYEHPTSAVWTLDVEQWIEWAESYIDNNPTADVHDILDDYPMDFDEYEQLASVPVEAE